MFEDSLVSATAPARSNALRVASLVSITMQAGLAATLCLLPLVRPVGLTRARPAAPLFVPVLHRMAPVKPVRASAEVRPERTATLPGRTTTLPRIRAGSAGVERMPEPMVGPVFGASGPPQEVLFAGTTGRAVRPGGSSGNGGSGAGAAHGGPVRVSSGVSAGLLLAPIRPVYPSIARATRTEGVVEVRAVISREGRVAEAEAVSGPPLLRQAALEAVRGARYRPFQLNGEATRVEAMFLIVFRMGGS